MDAVDRFLAAHHQPGHLKGLFTRDYRAKVNGKLEDEAQTVAHVRALRQAFPDSRMQIMGRLVRGDDVAITWRLTGTHLGPYGAMAPTGHPIQFEGTTRITLQDGRIRRLASRWDAASLDGQLRAP